MDPNLFVSSMLLPVMGTAANYLTPYLAPYLAVLSPQDAASVIYAVFTAAGGTSNVSDATTAIAQGSKCPAKLKSWLDNSQLSNAVQQSIANSADLCTWSPGQPSTGATNPLPSMATLDAVIAAALGGGSTPTISAASLALAKCPNVFASLYQSGQLVGAVQNWAAGNMGPVTADNLCTKLDQLRQDLAAMGPSSGGGTPAQQQAQAQAKPTSTPAAQQKSSLVPILLVGGVVISGVWLYFATHKHGTVRRGYVSV